MPDIGMFITKLTTLTRLEEPFHSSSRHNLSLRSMFAHGSWEKNKQGEKQKDNAKEKEERTPFSQAPISSSYHEYLSITLSYNRDRVSLVSVQSRTHMSGFSPCRGRSYSRKTRSPVYH